MNAVKRSTTVFASTFAAAGLAVAAPAAAQDNTPAPATTTAPQQASTTTVTPVVAAPAAPLTTTDLPDLTNFDVQSMINTASRDANYLCPDGTQSCWSEDDRKAQALMEFRTMMMVTTLGCHSQPGLSNLHDYYNSLLTKNVDLYKNAYTRVGVKFTALAGAPRAGMRAQDTLSTTNANIYSRVANNDGFCQTAGALLRHAASLNSADELAALSYRVILRPTPAAIAPQPAPGPTPPPVS